MMRTVTPVVLGLAIVSCVFPRLAAAQGSNGGGSSPQARTVQDEARAAFWAGARGIKAGSGINPMALSSGTNATALSSLTPTVFAGGVAEFLIDRAQREVVTFAVDSALRRLCDTRLPYGVSGAPDKKELKLAEIFKSTCKLVKGHPPPSIATLKEAVKADLRGFPAAIGEWIHRRDPKVAQLGCYLPLLGSVVTKAEDGVDLYDLLITQFAKNQEQSRKDLRKSTVGSWQWSKSKDACTIPVDKFGESLAHSDASLADDPRALIKAFGQAYARDAAAPSTETRVAIRVTAVRLAAGLIDDDGHPATLDRATQIVEAFAAGNYVAGVFYLFEELDERIGDSLNKSSEWGVVRSVLPMLAEVASSSSVEGVAGALDRFAAPVGTWRGKHSRTRQMRFGLSVNGYVGMNGGREFAGAFGGGWQTSPTLSVGLDFALGWKPFRLSFYVPLIDVGNLVSLRWTNEGTEVAELAPDIRAAQVLSPGLYLLGSVGRSPVVGGVGFNWIPSLRSDAAGTRTASAFRFGLVLAVDVTILPIYGGL